MSLCFESLKTNVLRLGLVFSCCFFFFFKYQEYVKTVCVFLNTLLFLRDCLTPTEAEALTQRNKTQLWREKSWQEQAGRYIETSLAFRWWEWHVQCGGFYLAVRNVFRLLFCYFIREQNSATGGENACLVCVSLTGLLLLDGRKEATVLVELRHRKKNISVQL